MNPLYREIFENALDAIAVVDSKGSVVLWNRAAEKIFGYTFEEIKGKDIHLILCSPEDYKRAERAIKRFQRNGKLTTTGKSLLLHAYKKDGSLLLIEESLSSFIFEDRTYFVGIMRIKADYPKISSEPVTFIEKIIDVIPVPIFIKDEQLKYLYVNSAFEEFTGISKLEVKGKTVFSIYPHELAKTYHEQDLKMLNEPQKQVYSFRMINKNGVQREVEFHKASFLDHNGKIGGIIGIFFDVQERNELLKEVEERRKQAEEALMTKSRFLSYMSHELRTPLNNIIGFSNVLLNTKLNYQQEEYLRNIINASENLLAIISDILELSKLENYSLKLNPEPVNLPNLILNVVDNLKFECYLKGLEFNIFISPILPEVVIVDGYRLRQILINLISNAIKFTEKGYVELEVQCEKENSLERKSKIKFTVKDTGIGITKEELETIFEPFQRGKKISVSGTGLGLNLTKKLLEMMGSEIKVSSEPGKGSKFYFQINVEIVKDKSEEYFEIFKDKRVILLLNLDKKFITLMNYLLYWGMDVTIPSNDKEIEILLKENSSFDLLILDKDLKIFNFQKVSELIKKLRERKKIRTAVMLYRPLENIEEMIKKWGFLIDIFMQKPINPHRLYDVIVKSFEEKKKKIKTINLENLEKLKILIVDDVEPNIRVTKALLSQIVPEAEIFEANNGETAIIKYRNNLPDVIFMDLQMPIMDGFEALKIIRDIESQQSLKKTYIFALTANADDEEKERALKIGFDEYLTKPITMNTLKSIFVERIKTQHKESKKRRIDFEYFESNNLNKEFIENIFKLSLKTIPRYINDINNYLLREEIENVKKTAHKLKGSAYSAGFSGLAKLADSINKEKFNLSDLKEKVSAMQEEWEALQEEIEDYLKNN